MVKRTAPKGDSNKPPAREERLKKALKANLQRRKEQARARTASDGAGQGEEDRKG